MQVKVNNVEIKLDDGSTIKDAIEVANAPYIPGSAIALIKGRKELESSIMKYKIRTTQGSIIIELDSNAKMLTEFWKNNYMKFKDSLIRWTSSKEAAMGSIVSDLKPTNEEFLYDKWDVIVSLASFSNESTHIIFSKDKHKSIYGVPDENKGIMAHVAGGRRTIAKLTNNDSIVDIEPVLERKSVIDSTQVSDLDTKLEDGNELYTYIEVEADRQAPVSFEHFLKVIEDGTFKVDYESNTFIQNDSLKGLERDVEDVSKRNRGCVTLRNQGHGVGRVYIYRESRILVPSHNEVGRITQGMELLDIAKHDDRITTITSPPKISTVGLTQLEADKYLEERGIEHMRDGVVDDDAVVVAQDPNYTVEIAEQNKIKTLGVPKEDFVEIELYPDASPSSVWYFRKITGLFNSDVGHLLVNMAIKDMQLLMFKAVNKEARGLIPEKLPEDKVNAWDICVSNTACKQVGNIGIRFVDNSDFGPTGESFAGTNIIGRVVGGFDNMKNFKDGDTIYVKERK